MKGFHTFFLSATTLNTPGGFIALYCNSVFFTESVSSEEESCIYSVQQLHPLDSSKYTERKFRTGFETTHLHF